MRSILVIALVASAASAPCPSFAARSPAATTERIAPVVATRRAIESAREFLQDNDLSAAAAGFDGAIRSVGFDKLKPGEQYAALSTAGAIAAQQRDHATAHPLLMRATGYEQATGSDWHNRLYAAYALQDYGDSARSIATIAKRWPRTLAHINDVAIFNVAHRLESAQDSSGLWIDLVASLFDAHWTADGMQPNELWRDLVRINVARGSLDKAIKVASRIDSASVMLAVQVEKRFDRVTRGLNRPIDIERIAQAELERIQASVRAKPDSLQRWIDLQYVMLRMLQHEQVLANCDEVIERVRSGDGASLYTDFDSKYSWVLDLRASALVRLGRWDEAIRQQEQARRRPESGSMNVSQSLNLGQLYVHLDRPADAREAVAELGQMSAYGRMQLEVVRLAASVQENDEGAIETHLAFLREHRADAIETYQRGLLWVDRLDAAADLLVERLRSDTWRSDALVAMQDYPEMIRTASQQTLYERWLSVVARPEVQAELRKFGRTMQVNLAPPRI